MAMRSHGLERVAFLVTLALAAGALAWGIVAEQLGETLFNGTLV